MVLCKGYKKNVKYINLVKIPGVGEYRIPSDFGYYESAKK